MRLFGLLSHFFTFLRLENGIFCMKKSLKAIKETEFNIIASNKAIRDK